jgi:hypothetical protein
MEVRLCNSSDVTELINVINQFDSIYGINLDTSGIRQAHISNIIECTEESNIDNVVAIFDDNKKMLGYCVQKFSKTKPIWFIVNCYILPIAENVNQYNASKIGGKLVEYMVSLAEHRSAFEFCYIVRDFKNKRLSMTLDATDTVKEKYAFEDIDHIPPFGESKFKFVKNGVGSLTVGKNTKPLIVRRGYLKK